jgi:DNA polymerase III delta subunit
VPLATPETLRGHVAGRKLQPVYLLVGDDNSRIDALAAGVADTVEDELRAFNVERLYASDKAVEIESSVDAVVEAARVAPMMAPWRVVMVLRAEKWLKPKRVAAEEAGTQSGAETHSAEPEQAAQTPQTIDKGATAPLIEYLKRPVPSTVLVFVASDMNKSTALAKAFDKHATVIECWGLAESDTDDAADVRHAMALIRTAASAEGRQFEPAAAQLLVARSGGDVARLRGDLEHVLLFTQGKRAITRGDVEAVVSERQSVPDHWTIVRAIERNDAAEALRLLGLALEDGAIPVMILGQLAYFVRQTLPRTRPRAVAAAIQAVFRTDQDLKSSGGDSRVLLERLVLELCGEPRRRGRG